MGKFRTGLVVLVSLGQFGGMGKFRTGLLVWVNLGQVWRHIIGEL